MKCRKHNPYRHFRKNLWEKSLNIENIYNNLKNEKKEHCYKYFVEEENISDYTQTD